MCSENTFIVYGSIFYIYVIYINHIYQISLYWKNMIWVYLSHLLDTNVSLKSFGVTTTYMFIMTVHRLPFGQNHTRIKIRQQLVIDDWLGSLLFKTSYANVTVKCFRFNLNKSFLHLTITYFLMHVACTNQALVLVKQLIWLTLLHRVNSRFTQCATSFFFFFFGGFSEHYFSDHHSHSPLSVSSTPSLGSRTADLQ